MIHVFPALLRLLAGPDRPQRRGRRVGDPASGRPAGVPGARLLARTALLAGWTLAVPPPMQAQVAGDVQRYRPPPGIIIGAGLADPRPAAHGQLIVGGSVDYAHGVTSAVPSGTPGTVTDLTTVNVSASLGLFGALEIGVLWPVTVARLARGPSDVGVETALGDARAQVKARLWQQGPVLLGTSLVFSMPTASQGYPFGDPGRSLTPAVTFRAAWPRFVLAVSAGVHLRERVVVAPAVADDAVRLSAATELWFVPSLSAFGEAQADLALVERPRARDAVELLGGLSARLGDRLVARAGAGLGLSPQPPALGSPELRVLAGATFVLDALSCRMGPEDADGFRDEDHCADPDNDQDGLPDEVDGCPNDPEDRDGFLDADGCPDPDDDADGLPDDEDRCPRATEDWDGFDDADGCPEPDNDQDGVADGYDVCGMEPEDPDGFEDDDGCPEPGPQPATVTIARDRILVSERIYFEYGRDVIRPVSRSVLTQIAEAIQGLPDGKRVLIVGHTDDRGEAAHNADLSLRRARAVRGFLVAQHVPAARLACEGRGGLDPVAPNNTPDGRAMNRRVEFRLLSGPPP